MPTSRAAGRRGFESLGDALASAFGLAGWFGVDYILRDEIPWPVEINPRYTASVEIHELATGRSLLCRASGRLCGGTQRRDTAIRDPNSAIARVIAKWILYAPRAAGCPGNRSRGQ